MADINEYWPFLVEWEGSKYENVNGDSGGCTIWGITVPDIEEYTTKDVDCLAIQKLTEEEAKKIFKQLYWDFFKCDDIKSQSVAEAIVDFGFNTGKISTAKKIQIIVNTPHDGYFGSATLEKINGINHELLFNKINARRRAYYHAVIESNPSQTKFGKGWISRVNALKFKN